MAAKRMQVTTLRARSHAVARSHDASTPLTKALPFGSCSASNESASGMSITVSSSARYRASSGGTAAAHRLGY